MKQNWESTLVTADTPLRVALQAIDRSGTQMALVVDANRRLLGTLSDGDARRALLRGVSLTDPVSLVMHAEPTCARVGEDRRSILATMRRRGLHQVPVVDSNGIVVGLETLDDFLVAQERDHWVVIMAGGLGSRLEDLTRDRPKPMLTVGSRPLLETIVRGYADQGFKRFYFAVNYKAEQIEDHFGDGGDFGVEIRYLRETQRMGTAGALSLLPEVPSQPFVVTNADLLTKVDFGHMLDRHAESACDATMAVREYEMQVPFGVVREDDGRIQSIEEKPLQRFVVVAGIYVLSPQVLSLVPKGQFFDMPALFQAMVEKGLRTRCHYIDGYWLDIGRMTDYERANIDFAEDFSVINGKSVLGLVAARGGSKGVPGKNIRPVAGRPLIDWTIEAAKHSRYVDRLVLSSDDPTIIAVAERLGCEAPFRRADDLSTDDSSSIDVVIDALERLSGHDVVVLLQPTSPLRVAADIDGVLDLLESTGAPACVTVCPAEEHPYLMFSLDGNACLTRFAGPPSGTSLRRQDLPPVWCLNGAVYAARVKWFLRERTFISAQTVGYQMPRARSLDIDTIEDIDRFESFREEGAVVLRSWVRSMVNR